MAVEMCVLASGSGGNSTIVRCPGGVMLIDAGIGPRTAAKRMDGTGVSVKDVSAICLTHLDSDHFNSNWILTLLKQRIHIHCHHRWAARIVAVAGQWAQEMSRLVQPFDGQVFSPLEGLELRPIPLAHDEHGSHGFLMSGFGSRVGYATDLGRVSEELLELFCGVDVLALESNYDPQMQLASARPWYLKHRIMGGAGHLSNGQALEAVASILERCQKRGGRLPVHIVLLHRSRQCNCPKLLRKLFSGDARIAARLTLAEQFQRTAWLRVKDERALVGEQLQIHF